MGACGLAAETMKGDKEDNKLRRGPIFPRLHVNNAEKGGPRAPPRNKMALYEQLSVPSSQRFVSSARLDPLLLHDNAVTFNNSSSSQVSPAHSIKKTGSWSSREILNAKQPNGDLEPKLANKVSLKVASSISGQVSMRAKSISSLRYETLTTKDLPGATHEDGDKILTSMSSDLRTIKTTDKEKVPIQNTDSTHCSQSAAITSQRHEVSGCNCSEKLNQLEDKSVEDPHIVVERSSHIGKSLLNQRDFADDKKDTTVPGFTEKTKASTDIETTLLEQEGYLKRALDQAYINTSLNGIANLCNSGKSFSPQSNTVLRSGNSDEVANQSYHGTDAVVAKAEDLTRVSGELNFREFLISKNDGPNQNFANERIHSAGMNDEDVSEASVVASVLGPEISPDDVVEVIGPKHFWKARRAIVNQQRIFSVQVFELHRLIKVQKYFAASPHLLVDDLYSGMPPQKIEEVKGFSLSEAELPKVMEKHEPLKPSQNVKCSSGNHPQRPLPSVDSTAKKTTSNQGLGDGCCDTGHFQGPVQTDRNIPLHIPSLGGQWLVPLMSPSEGLIYKIIPTPLLTKGSLTAPCHNSGNPTSIPTVSDVPKQLYAISAFPQCGRSAVLSGVAGCLPPRGLHVVNPALSRSAEQSNVQTANQSHGQPVVSVADVRPVMRSGGSCNVSVPEDDSHSYDVLKFQTSKDSEFQGSTASTPSSLGKRVQERTSHACEGTVHSLQLFPLIPSVDSYDPNNAQDGGHQSQVIKVVPHNGRSATLSAARIFQSIQKERQQKYDSLSSI